MKFSHSLLCALVAASLVSCSDDSKDNADNDWLVNFNDVTAFNDNGSWAYCYDPGYSQTLTFFGAPDAAVNFSHSVEITEWDGVEYKAWRGFCPGNGKTIFDYTEEGTWTDHQWTAMSANTGNFNNFMVGFCTATETAADATTSTTTVIKPAGDDSTFVPHYATITNTSYGYYGMKNGSAFNRAFTKDDWCKLTFTGVSGNTATGHVDFYLAKDGAFVAEWTAVDLKSIGECERLVLTMESSDTGEWGMNNPSYFAMGSFVWGY